MEERPPVASEGFGTSLLLLAIALIVYGSLFPWRFDAASAGAVPPWTLLHSWPARIDRFVLRDFVLNVALYSPVGALVYSAFARRGWKVIPFAVSLLVCLAVSTAMEVAQVYIPGRDASWADVTTNVAGGVAGAVVTALFGPALRKRLRPPDVRHARTAAFLLGFWAVSQWFPFLPPMGRTALRAAVVRAASGPVSLWEASSCAGEWFVAALAARECFGRLRPAWIFAAVGALAGHVLIAPGADPASAISGAAAAVILWIGIPDAFRFRAGALLLAAAVGVRELMPFHLSAAPAAFSWIPFEATFRATRSSAAVVIARKAFDYGAAAWLLRKSDLRAWSAFLPCALLLAFEAAQKWLPGRTPEITDSVVALLMAAAVWAAERNVGARAHAASSLQCGLRGN